MRANSTSQCRELRGRELPASGRRLHLLGGLVAGMTAGVLLSIGSVMALPATGDRPGGDVGSAVTKAQVSIHFGYGRPYPYHRPYGYYGPYYRPYYYEPPPPPPVTYHQTQPYVVRPAPGPSAYGGDPDALAKCASRFRSFNAHTGTYTTYEGEQRLCPYLR